MREAAQDDPFVTIYRDFARTTDESLVSQFPPEKWQVVQDLFGRLLDGEDPSLLAAEPDQEAAAEAARLWKQNEDATREGFLTEPITLVRDLMQDEEQFAFEQSQLLAGRFRIQQPLGAGGMGQVYLARDEKLGGVVAIKTIRPSLAVDPAIRERFLGEIQSARRVTHPNVCRIFDLFEEGQTPFYSMEFLPGMPLHEFLVSEGMRPEYGKPIAIQLAEGLHAAHREGIIHRDFKPQNVILMPAITGAPRAVIMDFGLARAIEGKDTANVHSLKAGTADYMAPELSAGTSASVRSDIYALGKVLAQLMPDSGWAARCAADRVADRPESLEPVLQDLKAERHTRRWIVTGI